ncbi:MAG: LysM peptidoglycan-binding domain-containing protein [Anaerolineales bacterium]
MTNLCGKGVWLAHSYDLQRATEMATKTEATHLLIKVGHGPFYFPEITRALLPRTRSLGFQALAWVQITDYLPAEMLSTIRRALEFGYDGVVLFLGSALVTANQLRPLVDALKQVDIAPARLYVASVPPGRLPDAETLQILAPLCQGGWMPLCFPASGNSPEQVIEREVYQALGDLSLIWGGTPPVYPILSPLQGDGEAPFLPEMMIPWVETIVQHGVDFFSVYHAAVTEKALWPILQAANVACRVEAPQGDTELTEPGVAVPQPVYVTVKTSDTVWGLINRYGLGKEQFWRWNAHLWDSRGLPRDADYLQEGWRVRVQ